MNLKKSVEGYMGKLEGGKGRDKCCNQIITSKKKERVKGKNRY